MAYRDHLNRARRGLELARQALIQEITNYPTPIAGCDSEYNYLLSDRTRIESALRSLEKEVFIATPRRLSPEDIDLSS